MEKYINTNLIKSAVAEAKIIKDTALINAASQLQENFSPKLQAMFAEKLKTEAMEDEAVEETPLNEVEQVAGKGGEARPPSTKVVTPGKPKKDTKGNKDFKAVKAGTGPSDVPMTSKKVNEATEEDGEGKEPINEVEEEASSVQDEAGITSSELDEIIKELESEVNEEGSAAPEAPVDEAPPVEELPTQEPPVTAAPPAVAPTCTCPVHGEPDADNMAPPVAPSPPEVPGSEPAPVAPEAGIDNETPVEEEEINLDELLKSLNEETDGKKEEDEEEEKEELDETVENGMPKAEKGQDAAYKNSSTSKKNTQGDIENTPLLKENKQLKTYIIQANKTIEHLRSQINEVNLLNSKMFYTDRLFKDFNSQLDDSRKMKIVESFDLLKTIREVKISYSNWAESLNFGAAKPQKVMESVKKSSSKVTTITEGMASKVVASTKPSKEILSEGSDMKNRFKEIINYGKRSK